MAGKENDRPIAVYGAIVANLGIAVAKFIAAALTGSSAMLSEGIHSLVDTGNQGLLLLGIRRSRTEPDTDHPFGHGKELYFWSLIVAVVLFGVGGGVALYEGFIRLNEPTEIVDPIISYVVLAIAFVMEGASWTIAVREIGKESGSVGILRTIRSTKDPSVVTVLIEDSAALLGLIFAFVGILLADKLGDPRWDAVGSLAIGAILVIAATFLAFESRGLLIGERAETELLEKIRDTIEKTPGVRRVAELRTMHVGPEHIVVNAEVVVAGSTDALMVVERVDRAVSDLDRRLDVTVEPQREAKSASGVDRALPAERLDPHQGGS